MSASRTAVTLALALTLAGAGPVFGSPAGQQPPQQKPEQQKPEEQPPDEQPPVYEEQVVVTASKVEQQLVNAPATVSVKRR